MSLFEVPEEEIGKTRKIVEEKIEGMIKLSVPLVVDTRVEKKLGRDEGIEKQSG